MWVVLGRTLWATKIERDRHFFCPRCRLRGLRTEQSIWESYNFVCTVVNKGETTFISFCEGKRPGETENYGGTQRRKFVLECMCRPWEFVGHELSQRRMEIMWRRRQRGHNWPDKYHLVDDFHARPYNDGNIQRFGVRLSDKKAALEGWPKASVSAYVPPQMERDRLKRSWALSYMAERGEKRKRKSGYNFSRRGKLSCKFVIKFYLLYNWTRTVLTVYIENKFHRWQKFGE